MVTRAETLLRVIEGDVAHYHHQRMSDLQAKQLRELTAEELKDSPDAEVIAELRRAMVQTERDKRDVSITEREVLQPLREQVERERAASRSPRVEVRQGPQD